MTRALTGAQSDAVTEFRERPLRVAFHAGDFFTFLLSLLASVSTPPSNYLSRLLLMPFHLVFLLLGKGLESVLHLCSSSFSCATHLSTFHPIGDFRKLLKAAKIHFGEDSPMFSAVSALLSFL